MRAATRKHNIRHNGHAHALAADWMKIKGAFSDTASNVKNKANNMIDESVDTVKKTSSKAKKEIATYTARNPFKTLGAALAVGLVLGLWLKR